VAFLTRPLSAATIVGPMRFYGLADHTVGEAIELFPTREEAEAFLADVLTDEPGWEGQLQVVQVGLDA
jgi:hypothetical protein